MREMFSPHCEEMGQHSIDIAECTKRRTLTSQTLTALKGKRGKKAQTGPIIISIGMEYKIDTQLLCFVLLCVSVFVNNDV